VQERKCVEVKVCSSERERPGDKETERDREEERGTERDREGQRGREREREIRIIAAFSFSLSLSLSLSMITAYLGVFRKKPQ